MRISKRVSEIAESVTLKLNDKAGQIHEAGREVFNLTAGQLPYKPLEQFVELMRDELAVLKSFQYSPVAGFKDLRIKIMNHVEKTRAIKLPNDFDCVINNGGKHALNNILGCLVNPCDEVIILAPYWISYPELIKFYGGVPVVVTSGASDVFVPAICDIQKAITPKTQAIIINSPNNPAGIHYSEKWMRDFADFLKKYPDITIISDEIYYELVYEGSRPSYYYQFAPELLKQTVIVDGISKSLASTGLRMGYAIAPKVLASAISKLQGQTTSGANSLVQRALLSFDFELTDKYLAPIKLHLRENAEILREILKQNNLSHIWYQPTSAFYFIIDFSETKVMERFKKTDKSSDYAAEICEQLLESHGVAAVPSTDFGVINAARISLVLPREEFREAVIRIVKFMG